MNYDCLYYINHILWPDLSSRIDYIENKHYNQCLLFAGVMIYEIASTNAELGWKILG